MKRAEKDLLVSSECNELARSGDARFSALQQGAVAVNGRKVPEVSSSVEHTVLLGDVVQQPADHKPVDISHQ